MTQIGHSEKVSNMRVFLIVLFIILSFQSLTKADDISEFEIEGMSIGDSALEYFNKEKLIEFKEFYRGTDSKKFFMSSVQSSKFKKYDDIMFHFKENDPLFKIYSISAAIWFSETNIKNIKDCIKIRNQIDIELSKLFNNFNKNIEDNMTHKGDTSGKSFTHTISYWFENNNHAGVSCYELSKEFGGTSHLKVMVNSHELVDWINNVVYK